MSLAFRPPTTLPMVWPAVRRRVLTGAEELRLAEGAGLSRPERVGAAILAAFDRLDGQPADAALVAGLASGVRAGLLAQAAAIWSGEGGWFSALCPACGAGFDFPLRLADLPRSAAGAGFPVARAETSLGPRQFEVPNGGHEVALAGGGPGDARRRLVALIGLSDQAASEAALFTPADLAAIETAVEAVAPELADRLACACPECGAAAEVAVDPLLFALPRAETILAEVHLLARAYGWGERAILALPSPRRRAYVALVQADRRAERGRG